MILYLEMYVKIDYSENAISIAVPRKVGRVKKALAAHKLDAFLEAKVERANLTSDAHKWQAVIKSGEREARHVRRRCKKCLSCSRSGLVASLAPRFRFRFGQ